MPVGGRAARISGPRSAISGRSSSISASNRSGCTGCRPTWPLTPRIRRCRSFTARSASAASELAELGKIARNQDLRLSFHPSQYVILNSPDPELTARSVADLVAQAEILDLMGDGARVGPGDPRRRDLRRPSASARRWAEALPTLPEPVRRRLVLENDDIRFGRPTSCRSTRRPASAWSSTTSTSGVSTPNGWTSARPWRSSWQPGRPASAPRSITPLLGPSSARSAGRTGRPARWSTSQLPPIWTGHADFVNPFEFVSFLRLAGDLEFDVMFEAKAKDLALIRARRDIARALRPKSPRGSGSPNSPRARTRRRSREIPPRSDRQRRAPLESRLGLPGFTRPQSPTPEPGRGGRKVNRRKWMRIGLGSVGAALAGYSAWQWRDDWFEKRVAVVEPGRLIRGAWQRPGSAPANDRAREDPDDRHAHGDQLGRPQVR